MVDAEDIPRLIELGYRWCATYDKITKNYYGHTSEYYYDENGKRKAKRITLHEIIMNAKHIDHIHNDSKDNRKSELRKIEYPTNATNRKSRNVNNKSGYRNVLLDKKSGKYIIMLCIKNRRFRVGKFYTDVHEAGRDAEKFRQEYYGEFAGKS